VPILVAAAITTSVFLWPHVYVFRHAHKHTHKHRLGCWAILL